MIACFADYESLYIEPRDHRGPLKPQDAFNYLLKKGVFRAGLKLLCPNCELDSWVHLDDARTVNRCEYCGKDFNITPQLKDRDWAYRRSGLFGRDDHQRGGIPVALMLQQLQTAMHDRILAFTTGTDLDSITADIQKCETDFVLIVEAPRTRTLQIAIGECKSEGGEITADDVTKLTRVADALSAKRSCDAFIVFSKTSSFTPEEVERCKAAQAKYNRGVILLSERELKPYYLYEQTAKEFEIDQYASSFEQMTQATHNIYFEPRPKPAAPPAPTVPPQVATSSASPVPVTTTPPNSFLHFAYGSNMLTPAAEADTLRDAPGTGYVAGCQLVCDKVSTDGSGKGDMEHSENPEHRVYGVLFRINADEEAKLDKAEGFGRGYRQDEVRVVTPEGAVTARAYIATEKDKACRPYDWYKGFIVRVSTEVVTDGKIRQLADFQSWSYGVMDGSRSARIEQVDVAMKGAGFAASISQDIIGEMWQKWVLLATLGAINCLLGATIGQIAAIGDGPSVCLAILHECAAIAHACGQSQTDAFIAQQEKMLTTPGSSMTSSMYRDLKKGLPVEADAIVGDLLAHGKAQGVRTPLLAAAHVNLSVYQQTFVAERRNG